MCPGGCNGGPVHFGDGLFQPARIPPKEVTPKHKGMVNITHAIERAKPFFSFVIGLGLADLLFHRNYFTIHTLALPLETIRDKINRVDGKCYRYRVEDATCEKMPPV